MRADFQSKQSLLNIPVVKPTFWFGMQAHLSSMFLIRPAIVQTGKWVPTSKSPMTE